MATAVPKFSGTVTRKDFPEGFLFGSASSAFQIEGAHKFAGRHPSIWDTFLKENHPEIVAANGLNAIEFYFRYQNDIKIMKHIGFNTFRFSISWPRILPRGRRTRGPNGEELGVNKCGIDFYNNVINLLLENGIEPSVTLFHWDFPQALETEYLGFLSENSVTDFVDYADLCFREFGDRVKHWMTFNETWSYSTFGYLLGTFAPGRGSATSLEEMIAIAKTLPPNAGDTKEAIEHSRTPRVGDSTTEPYIVTHNQLLAHAAAVKLYRLAYQNTQKGQIGIGLVTNWFEPYTHTPEDSDAAKRAIDFMLGWLLDPVVFGKYPESMRRLVGNRLPEFTADQTRDLAGSFDFLGINYYTGSSVENNPPVAGRYNPDAQTTDHPLGQQSTSEWVYVYPEGLLKLLLYLKEKYDNPAVYITENGIDEVNDPNLSLWESLYDYQRISYYKQHIEALNEAILKGANVKGYYAWSIADNLEWAEGFNSRFGVNYVHFDEKLERYPKLSAGWFKFFLDKA